MTALELACHACGTINTALVASSEWRRCTSCGNQIYFKIGARNVTPIGTHVATPEPVREALCRLRKMGVLALQEPQSGSIQVEFNSWSTSPGWQSELFEVIGKLKGIAQLKMRIGGEQADQLVASIDDGSALAVLDLHRTQLTDRGLEQIGTFQSLKELDLSSTRITDAGLVHLTGLTRLARLSLSGARVTPDGLIQLRNMHQLESLDISWTNVTDKVLATLADLTNLRNLSLSDTLLTDAAVEPLSRLPDLSVINLQGSCVTAEGVTTLASRRGDLKVTWSPSRHQVGYWCDDHRASIRAWGETIAEAAQSVPNDGMADGGFFIHPRHLVDPGWAREERPRIVRYLTEAPVIAHSCGLSYCRFGCGTNGSGEHSDGVWVWPEGLAHYLHRHDVRLPEDFVAHMRSRHFRPPATSHVELFAAHGSSARWRRWCAAQRSAGAPPR
jgi:Leucine Rich repeat